jgi:hypothetical protein
MARFRFLSVVLLLLLLAAGCSGRLQPRGRLTKNGDPYLPGEHETVHLALIRVQDAAPAPEKSDQESSGSYVATFNREDGTFLVGGADGKGLPAGKYRVTVQIMKNKKDLLNGAFGAQNSPIVREVTGKADELNLDLAHPNG